MTTRTPAVWVMVASLAVGVANDASAQAVAPDSAPAAHRGACPATLGSSGFAAGVLTSGDSVKTARTGTRDTSAAPDAARRSAGAAATIDTTVRFAVANRTWTFGTWSGSVSAGAAGRSDREGGDGWHVCVGAAVSVRRATVTLHDARGLVHLRASLAPLAEKGEATTTREPPRR